MSHDTHTNHSNTIYYKVFTALLILTIVTVTLNHFHLAIKIAVTLALLVAVTKASLVVSFFMHLIAEKKLVYVVLIFTAFFFISMIGLILGGNASVPEGTVFLNKNYKSAPLSAHGSGHPEHGGEEHP